MSMLATQRARLGLLTLLLLVAAHPTRADEMATSAVSFGDATLATRDKGRPLVAAQRRDMLKEVETLRHTPIPE